MDILEITIDNFESEVLDAPHPVLLDFWATWCGHCTLLTPILKEIAAERPSLRIGKINVDEQPELSAAFEVSGIPRLVMMIGGKAVLSLTGARPKEGLLQFIDAAIAQAGQA